MKKIIVLGCVLVMFGMTSVRAQAPQQAQEQLSSVEILQLNNAGLLARIAELSKQVADLTLQLSACSIETTHAGYSLDLQKGLVKKAPAVPAKD